MNGRWEIVDPCDPELPKIWRQLNYTTFDKKVYGCVLIFLTGDEKEDRRIIAKHLRQARQGCEIQRRLKAKELPE